ncbi:MAG: CHAT domain-containing protein, partial [Bacteroidales bacterium]|nr:CHAT domain-containing protein [Bacteroidales bacterium]
YMGKELYKFLFGSIETQLAGKDELIIIPDGILSFLPFETLIMPDGRYLIEKYNIKYTQSLTVSGIIDRRKYRQNRKTLLAFGGAVYDEISYETDIIKAEKQLENLKNETLLALNRGQSTRNAYNKLGIARWENLPGTLTEVKSIQYIVKNSDIFTGESVNESKIKSLSKKGDLKKYKVIHFATHGLVVPEIPELSAIVLSLSKDEKNNEDGYLTMNEIAGLDINADFVNLSACETGLGKIYGGEGVVGLTQSFLIAGANGLSVSLWQVADESTMKFMIGVYKLVQEKGLSYDKAITEMKRAFISGAVSTEKYDKNRGFIIKKVDLNNKKPNDYSSPFYWAPFVYYGK